MIIVSRNESLSGPVAALAFLKLNIIERLCSLMVIELDLCVYVWSMYGVQDWVAIYKKIKYKVFILFKKK